MNKTLPDKWIRKAVYTAINNIVVDGNTIPCYDTRVTSNIIPDHYILMTTQTNTVQKENKCENFWQSDIVLDIITSYDSTGNPGSRLLADNIMDSVRNLTKSLTLDVACGLTIIFSTQNFPNDITTLTPNETIFRKLMRLELKIK